MLFIDRWQEVLETMRRHPLRTSLTGLSVAWGIFMLVLLLGAGNGLRTAVESRFADDAVNAIWIFRGKTSMPYRGHGPGRQIKFTLRDYDAIRTQIEGVGKISARFYIRGEFTVSYRDRSSSFDVRAVHPDHLYLEKTIMQLGRFVNDMDVDERRKIAVIGDKVAETLFRGESAVGKYIKIRDIQYRVVGVFEDQGSEGERRKIYIPVSTAQLAYNAGDQIHQIMFIVDTEDAEEAIRIEDEVRRLLAARHIFDPEDTRALRTRNGLERFQKFSAIFDGIALVVWLVGIGTIIAGIVGVSNVTLISVRERTVEFGVRKALGATPWSIVSMVLQEAILLTGISGYAGLVAGVGLLELASALIPENDYFSSPEIHVGVALVATVLLVLFGALAGYFPARRASRVHPIVALRNE